MNEANNNLVGTLKLFKFQYHPSGQAFASASEDKTARMFDLRSDQQLSNYAPTNPKSGFTSCGKYTDVVFLFCKLIEFTFLLI